MRECKKRKHEKKKQDDERTRRKITRKNAEEERVTYKFPEWVFSFFYDSFFSAPDLRTACPLCGHTPRKTLCFPTPTGLQGGHGVQGFFYYFSSEPHVLIWGPPPPLAATSST